MYKTRASNLSFPFFDQGEGKKCAKWQVFCKNKICHPENHSERRRGSQWAILQLHLANFCKRPSNHVSDSVQCCS